MAFTAKPEILSPRLKHGSKAFDDENLDVLSHLLDDFIKIPGVPIRFGLDGIVESQRSFCQLHLRRAEPAEHGGR